MQMVLGVPGSLAVNVECTLRDLLLGVQSLSQSLELVEFHGVVLHGCGIESGAAGEVHHATWR